jgi:3-phosphoshikimate 1-carboxyvinyltransferase
MKTEIFAGKYHGTVCIPSSKSDGQRALIIAALCTESTIIENLGTSNDELSVLRAIEELGVKIRNISQNSIEITGISKIDCPKKINLGESGLGFRLMTSVVSLFDFEVILDGEGSLRKRPMEFFKDTLSQFGVEVKSENSFLPLKVTGPILGNEIEIDGSLSSQFLSGLLIALPFSKNKSVIHVKNLNSIPYIDMTIASLTKFGIEVKNEDYKRFEINGNQKAKATKYPVEGDWSSAAFWLVASALGQKIKVSNLNLESLQADKRIIEILQDSNCILEESNGELSFNGENRRNLNVNLTHCPDLFPILAVYAALTPGKNKLIGTSRLIHKESNRALALQKEFNKLNINLELSDNEMIIQGEKRIFGAEIDAHNDHRIAMAFGILGMFTVSQISINNSECISKSYPSFWEDLDGLK